MDHHHHQREEQQQDRLLLLLHKEEEEEEQDDILRRCKEHTTNLAEKTSSVQVQGSQGQGNAACSLMSSSVGPSEALPTLGLAWTFQNGGDATPTQPPGVDSLSTRKRGRGRPTKDQQAQAQAKHLPPPTPTASRRGFKVGCGRPMLVAPASGDMGPPRSWRPIIIDKLLAAWWSVDAAPTGIKRPRGRPRLYRPSTPDTGDAASAGIKRGRGRPRKERPDAASSGIKRGRGRPRKEKPEARMCAETGYAFASTGIKRGGGHPELEMEMLAAAAAMLSETGDDALPTGTKGAVENPNPRTEKISAGDIMSMVMKRGRGRPRKDQHSQAPTTPTTLSTGGIKRGRGRPRKDQQSQALTTQTASTGGIKIGHGRPREEQQSQPKPPLTPLVSRRGIKVGCGRPMIIKKPPAARWPVDAALSGIKRPRGRPRKVTPSVATPAPETGDAMSAPETGDSTSAPETGDAVHAEAGDAASAVIKRGRGRPRKERPDAALSVGMKRGRGRPRKEKPEARMCGASMGFKRWGGQREAGMDMLAAAAAAMLAEIGDDAVATGWKQGS